MRLNEEVAYQDISRRLISLTAIRPWQSQTTDEGDDRRENTQTSPLATGSLERCHSTPRHSRCEYRIANRRHASWAARGFPEERDA